jgi:hypothetical protein
MHTHSVSCWRLSDKAAAIFALDDSFVRWSTRRPFPRTISTLHNSSASLITTFCPGKDSGIEESCAIDVKRPLPFPLVTPIQSSKGVRAFGRRGAHFREKYTRLGGKIQVHFTSKTVIRASLTVGKASQSIGAHFGEK